MKAIATEYSNILTPITHDTHRTKIPHFRQRYTKQKVITILQHMPLKSSEEKIQCNFTHKFDNIKSYYIIDNNKEVIRKMFHGNMHHYPRYICQNNKFIFIHLSIQKQKICYLLWQNSKVYFTKEYIVKHIVLHIGNCFIVFHIQTNDLYTYGNQLAPLSVQIYSYTLARKKTSTNAEIIINYPSHTLEQSSDYQKDLVVFNNTTFYPPH